MKRRMTAVPKLTAALACVALAAAAPASSGSGGERVRLPLREDSRLWLEGDSNLRGWSCRAEEMIPELTLHRSRSTVEPTRVEAATLRVPVARIECGHGRMNRDLRAALHASEHPEIALRVSSVTQSLLGTVPQRGRLDVIAHGRLTVAGVTQPMELDVRGVDTGDGALRVSGEIDILMTDFGVEPPTALLGLIKAKDRVTIRFDLTADYESLEEALGS
jgi:hypothetical protein